MRELEKLTKKLLEKIVLKIVEDQPLPITVTPDNIVSYLGLPLHTKRDHNRIGVGVAIGLGDSLYRDRLTYVEAIKRTYQKGENE